MTSLEVAYVGLVWRDALDGPGELARLGLLAGSALVVAGIVVGALVGLVAAGLDAAAARLARRGTAVAIWRRRLLTALAAPAVVALCYALLSGRRARELPAWGLVVAGASVAVGAALHLGQVLAAWLRRRLAAGPRARLAAVAAALVWLGAGIAAYVADHRVLRGLYPALHLALATTACAAVALALRGSAAVARAHRPALAAAATPARVVAVLLIAFVASVAGVIALDDSPTTLFLAYERTAVSAKVMRLVVPSTSQDERSSPAVAAAPPTTAGATARAAAPAAPSSQPGVPGPLIKDADLFLITIDALRADHLGTYGYRRATSPHIDAEARQGVVFDRAYAQAPNTSYSLLSVFTGNYMYAMARLGTEGGHETLADVLGRRGYQTAAFYPPLVFFVDKFRFEEYERAHFGFGHVGPSTNETRIDLILDAEKRVDQIINYLETAKPERVFLWTHLIEPHEPYDNHPGMVFGDQPVDRYDSEIAFADRAVGRLLTYIRRQRPRAVVVISADHGEEFGDHGGRYHGSSLYDEQVRVPLIITGPGIRPRRVANPVELVDLAPTALRLLGFEPARGMGGTDLGPWLADLPSREHLMPPAFAEVGNKKMITGDRYKLVCDVQYGFCELYDVIKDPGERKNLARAMPTLVATMQAELRGWVGRVTGRDRAVAEYPGLSVAQRQVLARGRLRDRGATAELAGLLTVASPEVRAEAARLLAALPDDQGTWPALRGVLAEPLAGPWAAAALARSCDPAARQVLEHVAFRDPDLTARAGLALLRCGAPALPLLGQGLRTGDVELRKEIVRALGTIRGQPEAVELLFTALRDLQVRADALQSLRQLRAVEAVAYFEGLLADGGAKVGDRQLAARALSEIQGKGALPKLWEVFNGENDQVVMGTILKAIHGVAGLAGAVRGGEGRVHAPRGELWVGVQDGAVGELILLQPAHARARAQLNGDIDAYRFTLPAGTTRAKVRGPATFLFGR